MGLGIGGALGIPSVLQAGLGLFQLAKTGKVKPRELSNEYKEVTDTQRNLAQGNMVGYAQAQNNIDASTAGAFRNLQDLGNSTTNKLATLAGINSNQLEAEGNLATANTAYQTDQKQNLMNVLRDQSDKKDEYMREAEATKSALTGAGIQNIFGGVSGGISAGIEGGLFDKAKQKMPGGARMATNMMSYQNQFSSNPFQSRMNPTPDMSQYTPYNPYNPKNQFRPF